jgi:hypothetical protein
MRGESRYRLRIQPKSLLSWIGFRTSQEVVKNLTRHIRSVVTGENR